MKINKLLATVACVAMLSTTFVGCGSTKAPENNVQTENVEETQSSTEVTALTTDVVVIGAGGGGLSAAIEAHDAGANVIIVEKMPFVGGNTARATGGITTSLCACNQRWIKQKRS